LITPAVVNGDAAASNKAFNTRFMGHSWRRWHRPFVKPAHVGAEQR
jgi:hypothetical protein